ncbi:MAG: type II toxin-antitoxin system HipA family toxin [Burkholderiaceae bacterium]|nr:type II toxin-antitoxin system HipA family toxin [Burkholderiaceae bacterium]
MGRRSYAQILYLWMNGEFVGTWTLRPAVGDVLQYDSTWVNSRHGRALSLSLPFTPGNEPHRGILVRNYFENLLPDSRDIRDRVARRFRLGSTDAFSLLTEVGRDCAGALQILPDANPPEDVRRVRAEPLGESDVANMLRHLVTPGQFGDQYADEFEEFRLSIAGAQEKTALVWLDGQWCKPLGSTPTTHILKLPLGLVGNLNFDMSTSIENEWLCLEVMRAYGLPVPLAHPLQFEDVKVLAVERFDRAWAQSDQAQPWIVRLPQEDMCQATGTPPGLKYESDGGPGVRAIMKLLATSGEPERDRRNFFEAQVIYWMLGATDGHAKNFSIFLRAGGSYEMTPFYDLLSAYPVMGKGPNMLSPFKAKLAMAVRSKNPHWVMRDIRRRHWLQMGKEYGILGSDGQPVDAILDDLANRTRDVVNTVKAKLPENFPGSVSEPIFDGLVAQAARLSEG